VARRREHALSDLDRWLRYVAATAYNPPDGPAYAELLTLADAARRRLGGKRMRLLIFHERPANQ
jgi:hypothetical protein